LGHCNSAELIDNSQAFSNCKGFSARSAMRLQRSRRRKNHRRQLVARALELPVMSANQPHNPVRPSPALRGILQLRLRQSPNRVAVLTRVART
jgi:hypothetical protein